MKNIFSKYFLLLLLIVFSLAASAQDGPPPASMPSSKNTILVDSIIRASHHEAYFISYCTEKVKTVGEARKWTAEKTNKILRSIKFEHYSSTIYNSYANYSSEDLKMLLIVLKRLNRNFDSWSCLVPINEMMHNNLDSFVENLIEGKYVTE